MISRISPQEAAQELLRRRKARSSVIDFTREVSPWWIPYRHHRVLGEHLDAVELGQIRRLMVMWPFRHGKTELASIHFPAYCLGRNPDRRIIASTYGAVLTNRFSRRCRNLVRANPRFKALFPGVKLSQESQSVTDWEIEGARGGFLATSVGGAITGMGFDIGLIDDPIKGFEAADSQIQRDALWEWYLSDFYTRAEGDAPIIVINTRWHEDDLSGRLLKQIEDADDWTILKLPAVAEADDIMGRQPGEALWPEKYSRERLDQIRAALGERRFAGLCQQSPMAEGGNEFKAEWFSDRWVTLPPIEEAWSRWDTSLKEREVNDRTAFITVAKGKDGLLYGIKGRAGHWTGDEMYEIAVAHHDEMRERFGVRYRGEYIEDAAAGALMLQRARTKKGVSFFPVHVPSNSKLLRGRSVAVYCEARKFRAPKGEAWWDEVFQPNILAFPLGADDDPFDAFVGAIEREMTGGERSTGETKGTWKRPR